MEEQSRYDDENKIKGFINNYLYVDENAVNSIYGYFKEQYLYSKIPSDKKIIIEYYSGLEGRKYVLFHTLFGRKVNDALSRAVAYIISKRQRRDVLIHLCQDPHPLRFGQGCEFIYHLLCHRRKQFRFERG